MLNRLRDILFAEAITADQDDYRIDRALLATGVVLLEAARADNEFSDHERDHILTVLEDRFTLSRDDAEELLSEAEDATAQTHDLFQFTNAINEHYTHAEKIRIVEEAWRLMYSDGVLTGHEDHLAHKLRNLLNLNHPQMIDAKMRVLNELRGDGN